MTTPEGPGLTAEAMDLLERLMALNSRSFPLATAKDLAAIEAATLARHVRETGCEGLREANERLRSALSACGDYIVGLGLPMGSRPVWETEYHALIDLIDGLLGDKHYPWLAALAPTAAASEEWTDEGDPGPFAEGIVTATEEVER